MPSMEEIRARERDPAVQAAAEATIDKINARTNPRELNRLKDQALRAKSTTSKIIRLRELAGELAKATTGVVACRAGCSHCCKMATLVSVPEAQLIAKETGRKPSVPAAYNQFPTYQATYNGVPCTFLKDGQCSIYAYRPFACRIHYTMDSENTLCEITPGVKVIAPHLNVNEYDMVYCETLGPAHQMKFADIREFFPPNK